MWTCERQSARVLTINSIVKNHIISTLFDLNPSSYEFVCHSSTCNNSWMVNFHFGAENLPEIGGWPIFFSQPWAGLTNQVPVWDSWAGASLTILSHIFWCYKNTSLKKTLLLFGCLGITRFDHLYLPAIVEPLFPK